MPTKLKILVALLALSVALSLVARSWIGAGVQLLYLIGLLKGREGIRSWLIVLAYAGIFAYLTALALAALVVIGGGLSTGALPVTLVLLPLGALGVGQCVFCIWCLKQPDVQKWMFDKSIRGFDVAA
jgi:hypothetical protein